VEPALSVGGSRSALETLSGTDPCGLVLAAGGNADGSLDAVRIEAVRALGVRAERDDEVVAVARRGDEQPLRVFGAREQATGTWLDQSPSAPS
jgi:hypothetical protein